jgi:hypothetical protein
MALSPLRPLAGNAKPLGASVQNQVRFMNSEHEKLSEQIKKLEAKVEGLADYLKSALSYLDSDPQSSLTKCRIVLEKILHSIYLHEMGKEPVQGMIGNILFDREFSAKIPARIRARMNFVREITNLGTHGGEIASDDANRILQDIILIAEWYVTNYDLYSVPKFEAFQSAEILPQLKKLFPMYLHSDIISVKFGQTKDRCYLEIASLKIVGGNLHDEIIKRTDLGFVGGEDDDSLFFKPESPLSQNVGKFLNDFDEISIINCTDLFTPEASTKIYEYWSEHGVCPPRT